MNKRLIDFSLIFGKRVNSEIHPTDSFYKTALDYLSVKGSRGLKKKPKSMSIIKTGELNPTFILEPGESVTLTVRGLRAALGLRAKVLNRSDGASVDDVAGAKSFSVNLLETGRISKVKITRKI